MKQIWKLYQIQLSNLFGIHHILHAKDKTERRKFFAAGGSLLLLLFLSAFLSTLYSFTLFLSFEPFGMPELLPATFMTASGIIVLFTTIYKASGILFAYKDYDLLMALPISIKTIIYSRILILYTITLLFTAVILLPACFIYAIQYSVPISFYFIFFFTLPFVPIVPLILATIIGTGLSFVSSRFRYSNFFYIILSIGVFLALFFLVNTLQTSTNLDLENLGSSFLKMLYHTYPLTFWYIGFLCYGHWHYFLLFSGVSVFLSFFYVEVISHSYKKLNTALTSSHTNRTYRLTSLKKSSPFFSLYWKEWKRYLSSPLYILNSGFSLFLIFLLSIATFFIPPQQITTFFSSFPIPQSLFSSCIPLIMGVVAAMNCTTNASISLEGKQFWILKTLPLSVNKIFYSKIAVNLTFAIPVYLFAAFAFTLVFHENLLYFLLLFLFTCIMNLFSALFGLIINLYYCNLEWTSEVQVIKQSSAVFLSLFPTLICAFIPVFLFFILMPASPLFYQLLVFLVFFLLDFFLYRFLITKGKQQFQKIGEN